MKFDLVKVKLSLAEPIKHYSMKAYGGVDVLIHIFLIDLNTTWR
jgi:hypothetical protein